jgi:hypothetical protein
MKRLGRGIVNFGGFLMVWVFFPRTAWDSWRHPVCLDDIEEVPCVFPPGYPEGYEWEVRSDPYFPQAAKRSIWDRIWNRKRA